MKMTYKDAQNEVSKFIIDKNISLKDKQMERAACNILMGGDLIVSVMNALDLKQYKAVYFKMDKSEWTVCFWAMDDDEAFEWMKNNLDDFESWEVVAK